MTPAAILQERIEIPCLGDTMEGELAYPEDLPVCAALLLLNPHPQLGGNLDNNVIRHLARRFAESGALTLRFNYRGIGNSTLTLPEGTIRFEYFATMEKERRYEQLKPDGLAAWNALRNAAPPGVPRILLGYSFGAILAGMIAPETGPARLAAISPPVLRVGLDMFRNVTAPKFFLAGGKDFVFEETPFRAYYDAMPAPKDYILFPDSDHFFRKEEERLFDAIAAWLEAGI
ncbi:MAG: hypothetical protein HYV27_14910 [Candidatus Hydrogenedentes bacterium]|nr:hypothetical protein [Candidatus Hydrogenedentota bacterium]